MRAECNGGIGIDDIADVGDMVTEVGVEATEDGDRMEVGDRRELSDVRVISGNAENLLIEEMTESEAEEDDAEEVGKESEVRVVCEGQVGEESEEDEDEEAISKVGT